MPKRFIDPLNIVIDAIEDGNLETVRELILTKELNVNGAVDETSFLGMAAKSGHLEIVQLMLEHNADVNLPPYKSDVMTALMDAVIGGNLEIVELLVEVGAHINEVRGGGFALMFAAKTGHQQIFNYLASRTSEDLRLKAAQLLAETSDKLRRKELIDQPTHNLIGAIKRTNIVKAQQAITSGASINIFDEYGYTPLIYAAQKGKLDTVQILLKAGANPNFVSKEMSPLIAAVGSGNPSVVEVLIAAGADINAEVQGRTALMQTEFLNPEVKPKIIELLTRKNINR